MSKAEYWQRGETIDFVNNTGAAIEANEIVVIGSRIGVAGTDIAIGELGSLHVFSVFEMPKKAGDAITQGQAVYYADGAITVTAGAVTAGYAVEAAAADAATVKVKLLG